ncbi:hypothetical protein N8508_00155 [bacterium]|nr:hypothetical protein [bacterium]
MSNIKINEELFLGKQELNRLMKFLVDDGYKLWFSNNVEQYGIVNRANQDNSFDNLKVVAGTTPDKITLKSGLAINSALNFIYNETDSVDVLSIPTDDTYRDLTIVHNITNEEKGTVDVAANGQITGTGTLFTDVLRGQPNFPVRIKFPNATINTGEYEVVSVTNNTDALLSGQFTVETTLSYVIVGTFTPDKPIPSLNKDIYNYDTYTLNLGGTPVSGTEFFLCRVKSDGVTMTISDRRSEYFQTKGDWKLQDFDRTANTLVGLEYERFDSQYSDKSTNIFRVGFGFRAAFGDWGTNVNNKSITITAGSGGAFKSTSDFTDGDFNGWRMYHTDTGEYQIIESSTIVATTITLVLRAFIPTVINSTPVGGLVIVPNCDRVEIITEAIAASAPNLDQVVSTNVANGYVDLRQKVQLVGASIHFSYRFIWGKENAAANDINVGDYYAPSAFDIDGDLVGVTTKTVLAGGVVSIAGLSSDNHELRLATIEGDATYARRDEINEFTERQSFSEGTNYALADEKVNLADDGNFFRITGTGGVNLDWMTEKPTGTKIVLFFTAPNRITNQQLVALPASYIPFNVYNGNAGTSKYLDVLGGTSYVFEIIDQGGTKYWQYVGTQANSFIADANEAWVSLPITGSEVKQNDSSAGTGTLGLVQIAPSGTATSYLRYKIIGKSVTIAFRLMGTRFKSYTTLPTLSLIVQGLPSAIIPSRAVESTCLGLCTSDDDCLTGVVNTFINNGGDFLGFRLERKTVSADYAFWNRRYELDSSPSLVVGETTAPVGYDTFLPDWEIRGTLTYEID